MTSVLQNAIFLHIPKTAGNSVLDALGTSRDSRFPFHCPSQCLVHLALPMFAIVRNPWARMVSFYEYLANRRNLHVDRIDQAWMRQAGFKKWLMCNGMYLGEDPVDGRWCDWTHPGPVPRKYVQLSKKMFVGQHRYWENGLPPLQQRPCSWWLHEVPQENIGRYENLGEDLERLSKQLGFSVSPILRKINATSNKTSDWKSLYDEESIEHVRRWHAEDIERFGYTFEDTGR